MFSPRSSDPDIRRRPSQMRPKSGTRSNLVDPPVYWYTAINGTNTTGVGQLGDAITDFELSKILMGTVKTILLFGQRHLPDKQILRSCKARPTPSGWNSLVNRVTTRPS